MKIWESGDEKEWDKFACEMQFALFCHRVKHNIATKRCSTETGMPSVKCSVFKQWLTENRATYGGCIRIDETTDDLYSLHWAPCVLE
jgi:hypothetical protein